MMRSAPKRDDSKQTQERKKKYLKIHTHTSLAKLNETHTLLYTDFKM